MTEPNMNANASTTVLQATGLHRTYRMGRVEVPVLRGVDLQVQEGEWLCVLGSSGSGKSTLLHQLGDLDRPDRGHIVWRGQSLTDMRRRERETYRNRAIGFVFQSYHLMPELNVLENVMVASMVGHDPFAWRSMRDEAKTWTTADFPNCCITFLHQIVAAVGFLFDRRLQKFNFLIL